MTAIKNGTLLVKDSNGNTARVATLSQTDITTLNTALTDIGTNSVSIQSLTNQVKTIQGRYVDVDTQQDITGLKVFNRPVCGIICKEERMDVNVVPTSEIGNHIKWQDKNAHDMGMVKLTHETGNWHRMEMIAIAQDSSGNNIYGQLAVSIKPDGSIRTSCPHPPVNSNDLSIATTAWVNTKISNAKNALDTSINANANSITGINSQITTIKSNITNLKSDLSATNKNVTNLTGSVNTINSNYVTLATDQNISGQKVFNRDVILKQSSVIGTNGWGDNSLAFVDKNNQTYGYIQPRYYDGVSSLSIFAVSPTDQTQVKDISVCSDGRVLLSGKQIKETVIESVRNGRDWYRVWSDGWIEQGGYVDQIAGVGSTRINFFRAFQTTDYNVSAGVIYAPGGGIAHSARIFITERGVNYMDIDWSNGDYKDGCYWRVEGY